MNLDAVIKVGHQPWLPNVQATDLRVLHLDDVPAIGTFRLGREHFVFVCVVDTGLAGVWAYLPISETEAVALHGQQFDALHQLFDTVTDLFRREPSLFAFAIDHEIVRWRGAAVVDRVVSSANEFLQWLAAARPPQGFSRSAREHDEIDAVQRELSLT